MPQSDYLIDIASKTKFENQNDAYHKAYAKWRMAENNRFGYKFTKDIREHAYAYGQGFEQNDPADAERRTLRDCSSLIGGVLLISSLIRIAQAYFDSRSGHLFTATSLELTGHINKAQTNATIALSLFKPLSLLLCIFLLQFFLKLPRPVLFPKGSKGRGGVSMCFFGIIGGVSAVCYIFSVFMKVFMSSDYMALPGGLVWCDNMWLNVHYFLSQYVVGAALHAVFLNGLIMQSLRQFGDSTAAMFTAVIEGIMAVNLANISTHLIIGLMVALMTVKSGSVILSMLLRITVNVVFFILRFVVYYYPAHDGELYTLLICITIMALALFSLGRLMANDRYEFTVKQGDTVMGFSAKMRIFFMSMPMIEFMTASIVAWLYIVVA